MKKIFFQKIKRKKSGFTRTPKFGVTPKGGGFTLVETMVAISLFLIIVVIGMGALLNSNLLHLKSRDMRSIIDSLSYIMEDMSGNLRTGYSYRCFPTAGTIDMGIPRSCESGWAIVFKPQNYNSITNNNQWVYYINNSKIFKSTDNGVTYTQLNPDEVSIGQSYAFSVLGAEPPPGDSQQPFVIIKLVGTITSKGVVTPFYLQTSASQRTIDVVSGT